MSGLVSPTGRAGHGRKLSSTGYLLSNITCMALTQQYLSATESIHRNRHTHANQRSSSPRKCKPVNYNTILKVPICDADAHGIPRRMIYRPETDRVHQTVEVIG